MLRAPPEVELVDEREVGLDEERGVELDEDQQESWVSESFDIVVEELSTM